MTIAWVFPGQGSQKIGMGQEIITLPGAQERFDLASELLGRDLFKISQGFKSDKDGLNDLNDTRNTQPAMFVVESLLVDALKRRNQSPFLVAGHSLGEIVALYAAEVFDVKTALLLLKRRSELMSEAKEGSMTAVMGFEREKLISLVKTSQDVVIANDNSDSQVVLSGASEALKGLVEELDCKRAVPLAVSGAFHSPFMNQPAKAFAAELNNIDFARASIPVISNSEPIPSQDPLCLKDRLKKQMTTGVRWRETMDVMIENQIQKVVEIGPGNVLSGLAKRSMKGVALQKISNLSEIDS